MKILITGTAGFIGSALASKILALNHQVLGIDNHNDYYDVKLKEDRVKFFLRSDLYQHKILDICNKEEIEKLFKVFNPDMVVNLAAQAGVRYSMKNPLAYINSNILGFVNLMECSKFYNVKHFVYGSSSSVYGANTKLPFTVYDNVDHPLSLYAASKKSNELIAHTYSNLYKIPTTGLRFFTAYGPWGRPDMALFKFTKSIIENKSIQVFNFGKHSRDFTYIDDIIDGIVKVLFTPSEPNPNWSSTNPDPGSSFAPWKIYNIGNNKPINLLEYVSEIEKNLKIKAKIDYLPIQPGDVQDTFADVQNLIDEFNYRPKYNFKKGIKNFVKWYVDYYKVNL